MVDEDLKTLGVEDWRETVPDRDRWRSVVIVAKILREATCQRKKKKKVFLTSKVLGYIKDLGILN